MKKYIFSLLILGLLIPLVLRATDPKIDKDPPANTLVVPAGMSAARAKQLQLSMQRALSGLDASFASNTYESVMQPMVATETNATRDSAARVFDKVKYIKELNVLNQELPIGIKKNLGNSTVEVALSKLILRPGYAEVTIYCSLAF